MAKAKHCKPVSVPNKALYSRVSYLYQASVYLATQSLPQNIPTSVEPENKPIIEDSRVNFSEKPTTSLDSMNTLSRRLVRDLRSITLKAQIRMSPSLKHTLCKGCNTVLIDGLSCVNEVENLSKGGRKPWADNLVRKCITCQTIQRFPLASKKQKRRPVRIANQANTMIASKENKL
ncbi:unnamed protein product [Blumeria hordei]|uniref:Uncharacterized protein n=1 Tax=Blumeria hordei TaxID=2867405 RepID=A0A383UYM8_BLUHO|nr:unnamed protein product [Blumeria hordei]